MYSKREKDILSPLMVAAVTKMEENIFNSSACS